MKGPPNDPIQQKRLASAKNDETRGFFFQPSELMKHNA
jgi:hypothetical protein